MKKNNNLRDFNKNNIFKNRYKKINDSFYLLF